ncbi:MAG TPA: MlaD family protein [Solirubrobacteraceae bacterium]|nr:MlaD family protein [Solirubrobacteraceae bacterium]
MSAERVRRAVGLVVFIVIGVGICIYLLGRVGTHILPQGSQYTFEADVHDSIALTPGADVREAGVLIGQVNGIKQAGSLTALDMQIKSQYGPVYRNGTVLVRAKSVAGENYVSLNPGTPSSGALSSPHVLVVSQDRQAVQDDDVFSIFGSKQQAGLQHGLQGLGTGLSGQGGTNLNNTIESTTALVQDGQGFARVLADERAQVSQLVDSFGVVTAALGARASAIQALTDDALTTARAVSARNADLRSTVAALPAFLQQARTTSDRLGTFSADATPVMSNLRVAIEDLVPAVQELRPASVAATSTLSALATFSKDAQPTFTALKPFAKATSGFVPPYEQAVQQLNPLVNYVQPLGDNIASFFSNMSAATSTTDQTGHLGLITTPISLSDFPTLTEMTPTEIALIKKLAGSGDTRGDNAYPSEGSLGAPGPQLGTVPPLQPDPAYTGKPKPLKP